MAARRLLIVMLVLLGLSTLAAALIPQTPREDGDTRSAIQATTTTTPSEPRSRSLSAEIFVGGKKVPVVAGPVCRKIQPRCEPIHVGDQLSLLVYSKKPAELDFREFGQFAFASRRVPARFELLLTAPGRFGILFAATGAQKELVAARIEVLTRAKAKEGIAAGARRRARGGSGRA